MINFRWTNKCWCWRWISRKLGAEDESHRNLVLKMNLTETWCWRWISRKLGAEDESHGNLVLKMNLTETWCWRWISGKLGAEDESHGNLVLNMNLTETWRQLSHLLLLFFSPSFVYWQRYRLVILNMEHRINSFILTKI